MKIMRPTNPNDDFTTEHYAEILNIIRKTHKTISFKDAQQLGERILDIEKFVIMRHDVEFSLKSSLQLAELDYEAGIHSTFFFLYTSDYNIFEEESAVIVQKILELGHDIGLHYDAALFERMGVDPVTIAHQQIVLMEKFWNTKVYAMSSHMPMRSGKTFSIPGVIDVYDPLYMKKIKYISDSTQRWRDGVVSSLLDKYSHIHLLMHDYYWSKEGHDWDSLLLLEAKQKFDAFWDHACANILRYREGLALRAEKDKEFKKRYMS